MEEEVDFEGEEDEMQVSDEAMLAANGLVNTQEYEEIAEDEEGSSSNGRRPKFANKMQASSFNDFLQHELQRVNQVQPPFLEPEPSITAEESKTYTVELEQRQKAGIFAAHDSAREFMNTRGKQHVRRAQETLEDKITQTKKKTRGNKMPAGLNGQLEPEPKEKAEVPAPAVQRRRKAQLFMDYLSPTRITSPRLLAFKADT